MIYSPCLTRQHWAAGRRDYFDEITEMTFYNDAPLAAFIADCSAPHAGARIGDNVDRVFVVVEGVF
jgi:hypothetical protein